MTGRTGQARQYITPQTGPIEVLETREDGRILAIIDEYNIVREMHVGNLLVYVDLFDGNRTHRLFQSTVLRYGIHFNQRVPPRI